MDKTAFLIVGPESAGSHVTTSLLIKMGCFGDVRDHQRLNKFIEGNVILDSITGGHNPIVLRRSVPFGKEWIDVKNYRLKFSQVGYQMKTIIVVRDWPANVVSQFHARAESIERAIYDISEQWLHIARQLPNLQPFYFFNTSFLFKDFNSAIFGLEWFTGLNWPAGLEAGVHDPDARRHEVLRKYGLNGLTRERLQQ